MTYVFDIYLTSTYDGTIATPRPDYIIMPEPIIHEQINKKLLRSIQFAEETRKSRSNQRRW